MLPTQVSLLHGPERAPLTALAHAIAVAGARLGKKSIFLDSGTNYKANLARAMCPRNEHEDTILSRISVGSVMGLESIEGMVEQIQSMDDVVIVVLDSLTGALNLSTSPGSKGRQRMLFETLDILREMVNSTNVHLAITDYSTTDWTTGHSRPVGGNVVAHAIDSLVRVDSLEVPNHGHRIMVERTPVTPNPSSVVVRLSQTGFRSLKAL